MKFSRGLPLLLSPSIFPVTSSKIKVLALENMEVELVILLECYCRVESKILQIAESQPYIGDCENFDNLEREYAPDDVSFHEKIRVSLPLNKS